MQSAKSSPAGGEPAACLCAVAPFGVMLREKKSVAQMSPGKSYRVLAMRGDSANLPQVLIAGDDRAFYWFDLSNFVLA